MVNEFEERPRITIFGVILNMLLWLLDVLRIGWQFKRPITLERLKNRAVVDSKETDFGDEWFENAFETTIALLNDQPLSSLGRRIATEGMSRRFVSRLKVKAALKADPSITARPLLPPVFVLGLPRTGTTFLHKLLALDPASRCPLTFELFDPLMEYPEDPVRDRRERVRSMQAQIDLIKRIVPQIDGIHDIGATEPEECFLAMSMDVPMLPSTFNLLFKKPQIIWDWDLTTMYKNYYEVLQLLSSQQGTGDDKRWVLKSPAHLGFIDYIAKAFPGCKIIWTHRDPCQSIPSLCSLFRVFVEMFYAGNVKLDEVGKNCSKFWEAMLERADKSFAATDVQSEHVRYEEFIKDPVGMVKGLYRGFGWEVTAEFEERMNAYVAQSKKDRAAKMGTKSQLHTYSMEEYGLDEADTRSRLSWYYDKYLKAPRK